MTEKQNPKSISNNQSIHLFLRNLAIGLTVLIVFLSLPNYCSGDCGHANHDHEHHHHHVDEPASFKWSRQANEVHDAGDHHHHPDDSHHHHEHKHHHHSTEEKIIKKAPSRCYLIQ